MSEAEKGEEALEQARLELDSGGGKRRRKRGAGGKTQTGTRPIAGPRAGGKDAREETVGGVASSEDGGARPALGAGTFGELQELLQAHFSALVTLIESGQRTVEQTGRRRTERSGGDGGGVAAEGLKTIEAKMTALENELKGAREDIGAVGDPESGVLKQFDDRVRVLQSDLARAKRAQRRSAALAACMVVLVIAPVLLGTGLVVQQEFSVLPEAAEVDETGGWRAYVWERYGDEIIECERAAESRGAAVLCEVAVGTGG